MVQFNFQSICSVILVYLVNRLLMWLLLGPAGAAQEDSRGFLGLGSWRLWVEGRSLSPQGLWVFQVQVGLWRDPSFQLPLSLGEGGACRALCRGEHFLWQLIVSVVPYPSPYGCCWAHLVLSERLPNDRGKEWACLLLLGWEECACKLPLYYFF